MRWYHARRRGGEKALRVRFSPGLAATARTCGRRRASPGSSRRSSASTTTPNHIGRLMHRLQWSHQKPERRAIERNEKQIEQWKRQQWPRIKKTARLGAHLVFADESGFLLIPNVAKTWAPVGQTPAATGGVGTGILLPARYSRAG